MRVGMLCELHPRLFHMADAASWPGIRQAGLLSTSALLDRFEIAGPARQAIEGMRRPESVAVKHPLHGRAVIRDTKPMTDAALRRCLRGLEPEAWYRMLNRKVFFWLTPGRLARLLGAAAYRDQEPCVLTVDTASLVAAHHDRITLSPINSGSTIRKPQPRGADTFIPISDYPFEQWRRKRGATKEAVVELTVDHAVPDIMTHTLRVDRMKGGKVLQVLWEQ